jgi:hypothetical protein
MQAALAVKLWSPILLLGLIAVFRHNGSVRYFENHGRYTKTWKTVAAQRDPNLRHLLVALRDRPDQTQQQLIEHARAAGLTRSATQRRLDRLEGWGLIQAETQGRTRRYRLNPFLEGIGPNGEGLQVSQGAGSP